MVLFRAFFSLLLSFLVYNVYASEPPVQPADIGYIPEGNMHVNSFEVGLLYILIFIILQHCVEETQKF